MIFLNDDVIKPEPDKGFVKIKRVWKQSILYFFLSKRIFAIRFATYLIRLKCGASDLLIHHILNFFVLRSYRFIFCHVFIIWL